MTDSALLLGPIIVCAPTANDASVAVEVLMRHAIHAQAAPSLAAVCECLRMNCAAIIIAEEALEGEHVLTFKNILMTQDNWSDLPIILLTGEQSKSTRHLFPASGNITLLQRPFARVELVNAAEVAVRARLKQLSLRAKMDDQKLASNKRDEFLATLSHELRTPLNVILGWTEILLSGKLSEDAQLDALKILDRNAKVQKQLIDDLLDTSRIITGKLFFDMRPLSLLEIIGQIYREYLPRTAAGNIKLSFESTVGRAYVMADEGRISQVVTNLLTNAIKFTPSGGQISISVNRSGKSFQVAIRDSGQGMDEDFLPNVFDRLKQEDMSTTRTHGGLGLGLSISYHIIREHGGTIKAESGGRGAGSVFTIELPETNAPVIEKEARSGARPAPLLLDCKVLLVDDSTDIRQLIRLWLERSGAVVRAVESGFRAIEELKIFQPDILLSDIGMPGMDGYQLIHSIRTHAEARIRDLPAGALTAYAKDEERIRALQAGFQVHISKPISSGQLIAEVEHLLSLKLPL